MKKYTFDLTFEGSIVVEAETAEEAQAIFDKAEMCFDANLGALPNGDPILCELSVVTIRGQWWPLWRSNFKEVE